MPLPILAARPDVAAAIIERVRQGVPLRTAATLEGLGTETIAQWERIYAGAPSWTAIGNRGEISDQMREMVAVFMAQVAQAQAEAEARAVAAVQAGAAWTNPKTGEPGWRAASWYLEMSPTTRERWHRYTEVHTEHSGLVRLQPVVAALPTAVLEQLAAADPPQDLIPPPEHSDS